MIFYKKAFVEMFTYFDDLLHSDDSSTIQVRKKHIGENIEVGLKYTKTFLTFVTAGGCVINCYDLYETNFTSPMRFLIPGIPQSSIFFYPCNIIYQICFYFAILHIVMGVDCVIMITICYFRGENMAIVELIGQLDGSDCDQEYKKVLKMVYEIHQIVSKNIKDLLGSYWHIYFYKLITIIMYLCFVFFIFQSSHTNIMIALLCTVIVMGEIFIICFFGQLLKSSAEDISEALYMTKWYEMDVKDQKNALLLLMRFQRPVKIEAFGFGVISIYTFVQVSVEFDKDPMFLTPFCPTDC
ncbi:odorant receptor 67c-like [Phlebotomus argentipes]|uniref:odorant receptor 67c-like n=1 Tax=Phlebotomus argentipes TaxID=94469 RepID=UPI0028932DF2|nr:odorant receptor 67c-like [Phlebotomus argentipes]